MTTQAFYLIMIAQVGYADDIGKEGEAPLRLVIFRLNQPQIRTPHRQEMPAVNGSDLNGLVRVKIRDMKIIL